MSQFWKYINRSTLRKSYRLSFFLRALRKSERVHRPTVILAMAASEAMRPLHRYRFPKFWLQKRETWVSRAAGGAGCGPCHGLRAEVTENGASVALAARRPRSEGESLDGPQLLNLDLASSYIRVTLTRLAYCHYVTFRIAPDFRIL